MTTADYANELLQDARATKQPSPYRFAFVDALEARGTDARTKQFKHYNRIVEWMLVNWSKELA